ncbi:MAG: VWA domain-containing protein, partial [Chloroflexota bacterium]
MTGTGSGSAATRHVDGRKLFGRAVGFGRALRTSGLGVDLAAAIDFARSLEIIDIGDREQVRAAGEAVFVRRKDDLEPYHATFDRYWRARLDLGAEALLEDGWEELVPDEGGQAGPEPPIAGDERIERGDDTSGVPIPGDHDEESESGDPDALSISPDAYSRMEALRHREFDRMTPAELRDAERLVDLLVPQLEQRRTRRYELHPHGRRIAPRAMFRRNLATGGEIVNWVWRRPVKRPRPLVVICDISGSMERHSRLLLRFVQALSASSAVKTESFVFGTRLTRVTRLLKDRNRDRALAKVADAV